MTTRVLVARDDMSGERAVGELLGDFTNRASFQIRQIARNNGKSLSGCGCGANSGGEGVSHSLGIILSKDKPDRHMGQGIFDSGFIVPNDDNNFDECCIAHCFGGFANDGSIVNGSEQFVLVAESPGQSGSEDNGGNLFHLYQFTRCI